MCIRDRLGIKTEEHDLKTKLRHIKEFLERGNKTKVIVIYRGREMAHPELGKELVQRVIQELADYGEPEYIPKQEGYNLVTIIAPHSKQQLERIRKQKEAEKQAQNSQSAHSAQSAPAQTSVSSLGAEPQGPLPAEPKQGAVIEEKKFGEK